MIFLRTIVLGLIMVLAVPAPGEAQSVSRIEALVSEVGRLHRSGELGQAIEAAKQVLELSAAAFGPDHRRVGHALVTLAQLYRQQQRFGDAEPLVQRGLRILEASAGPDDPKVFIALNVLAGIYVHERRYALAEKLYERCLAIVDKTPDDRALQITLSNLAALYVQQLRYDEAEKLFKRSLVLAVKLFGGDDARVGRLVRNMAVLHERAFRLRTAMHFYKRSIGILEKSLGTSHPEVIRTYSMVASLETLAGRYDKAEQWLARGLASRMAAVGRDGDGVGDLMNAIARIHFVQENWARAYDFYRQATETIIRRTRLNAGRLGQTLTGQRSSEVARSKSAFKQLVRAAYRLGQQDRNRQPALKEATFEAAQWATDGMAGAALAKMAARHAAGDGALAEMVRRRQDLVSDWYERDKARSAAIARPSGERDTRAEAENLAHLTLTGEQIAKLDARLAARFPDYASFAHPSPLAIGDVQRYLADNEALVLFLDTAEQVVSFKKLKSMPEATYVWVITKTQSRWVQAPVGSTALYFDVEQLRCGLDFVGAWKGQYCFDKLGVAYTTEDYWLGRPLPFRLGKAHALYRALFGAVEDMIAGKELLLVPSGPLTKLPFQVLVTQKPERDELTREAFVKASWLAKHHALTVLPSVASLKGLRGGARQAGRRQRAFMGFGNPLLDGDRFLARKAQSIRGCAAARETKTTALRAVRATIGPLAGGERLADLKVLRGLAALPETADELCSVARKLGGGDEDVYLGSQATETTLKGLSRQGRLSGAKVLHFATHGALAGEVKGSAEPGLVMTPPATATRHDDGYLSASEVAGLKLDADLVILSACNTAAGQQRSAEALSGLAKAFFYAGARSMLVSHWYVNSQATVALITEAVDALRRQPEIGRAEALRQAMLSLIRSTQDTWHPALWAPFILVGEGAGGGMR